MNHETYFLKPEDGIPNSHLPLIVYRHVFSTGATPADQCDALFCDNGWQGTWCNGIFAYWHYHARAHEVLGCVSGRARVGFGGDHGIATNFDAGDVVIIPAGVGHKRLSQEAEFLVVGGYPPGQNGAITDAGEIDLESASAAVARVPVPDSDPVYGQIAGLLKLWR